MSRDFDSMYGYYDDPYDDFDFAGSERAKPVSKLKSFFAGFGVALLAMILIGGGIALGFGLNRGSVDSAEEYEYREVL